MAHPFAHDIALNKEGSLSTNQIMVLRRLLRVRMVQVVLFSIVGVLGAAFAILLLSRDEANAFATYAASWLVIVGGVFLFLFGLAYVVGIIRIYKPVQSRPVRVTRGMAIKHTFGFRRLAPVQDEEGRWRLRFVPHGWVEVGDAPFGVLPSSLYREIRGYEEGIFYYVSLRTFGFRRYLVVNYQRA